MLVCWSLYEPCCLCVCVVDGDETCCLSRRDLSSFCLFVFSDRSRHVTDCRLCTSWWHMTTALQLRTIFVRQSVRPMFADCEVPVRILFMLCRQILRSTTFSCGSKSTARRIHSPHIFDAVIPAAHPQFRQVSSCTYKMVSLSVFWCMALMSVTDFESMLYVWGAGFISALISWQRSIAVILFSSLLHPESFNLVPHQANSSSYGQDVWSVARWLPSNMRLTVNEWTVKKIKEKTFWHGCQLLSITQRSIRPPPAQKKN